MHQSWLKNHMCVLGRISRSHARNGNEIQTSGRRGSAGKIEKLGFLIPAIPKHSWKSWKLTWCHVMAPTCCGNIFGLDQGWNDGCEEEREHLGENQGVPKWLSPNEMIQNSKFKTNSTENQGNKRGQKPGCHNGPHTGSRSRGLLRGVSSFHQSWAVLFMDHNGPLIDRIW